MDRYDTKQTVNCGITFYNYFTCVNLSIFPNKTIKVK